MIYIKVHVTEDGPMLAMCDKNLIGKIIEEGDIYIDLKDYAEFYTGELINPQELSSKVVLAQIITANIVGKDSIQAAIKNKIIEKDKARKLECGVIYAHSYRLNR